MAMFSVNADAAQQMVDYSGLQVCRFLPGRAIVIADTDALHRRRPWRVPRIQHLCDGQSAGIECDRTSRPAVGGHVHPPHARRPGVHLGSGRTIWGFRRSWPTSRSAMASQFGFDAHQRRSSCSSAWNSVPGCRSRRPSRSRPQENPTYSHLDGLPARNYRARCRSAAMRYRLGGVRLRLGDHPYAKELAVAWLAEACTGLEFGRQRRRCRSATRRRFDDDDDRSRMWI